MEEFQQQEADCKDGRINVHVWIYPILKLDEIFSEEGIDEFKEIYVLPISAPEQVNRR